MIDKFDMLKKVLKNLLENNGNQPLTIRHLYNLMDSVDDIVEEIHEEDAEREKELYNLLDPNN